MHNKMYLDRSMYKRIKAKDRIELSEYLQAVYDLGRASVKLDKNLLESNLKKIKGIGDARVQEILLVIQQTIEETEEVANNSVNESDDGV